MNKIGWCSMTFNPIWGCLNNCEYCYARRIAKRFYKKIYDLEFNYYAKNTPSWAWTGDYLSELRDFKPTFLCSQFDKKFPKKPQKIFVGSMSEIYYWNQKWIVDVIHKIEQYPQHIFQFLTRYPKVYCKTHDFPKNCWLGITITEDDDFDNGTYDFLRADLNRNNIKYISFEPLLGSILSYKLIKYFDWIILGAETGNRKSKVIPKREWIENIVNYCKWNNIPVYLKDSLKNIYPEKIKMFPEAK